MDVDTPQLMGTAIVLQQVPDHLSGVSTASVAAGAVTLASARLVLRRRAAASAGAAGRGPG